MTKAHFTDEQLEKIKERAKFRAAELDVANYPLPPLGQKQANLWPLGSKGKSYHTDFCALVVAHMSDGYSLESFAATIATSIETIRRWATQFPEFAYAIECGKAAQLLAHERLGLAIARTGKGGGDVWKFLMKNQHKWADKVEVTGADGGPIQTQSETKWNEKSEDRLLELMKKADKLKVDDQTKNELDQL